MLQHRFRCSITPLSAAMIRRSNPGKMTAMTSPSKSYDVFAAPATTAASSSSPRNPPPASTRTDDPGRPACQRRRADLGFIVTASHRGRQQHATSAASSLSPTEVVLHSRSRQQHHRPAIFMVDPNGINPGSDGSSGVTDTFFGGIHPTVDHHDSIHDDWQRHPSVSSVRRALSGGRLLHRAAAKRVTMVEINNDGIIFLPS
ncbi:hypothetical protein ACLOJK_040986 [Asimina triloba]